MAYLVIACGTSLAVPMKLTYDAGFAFKSLTKAVKNWTSDSAMDLADATETIEDATNNDNFIMKEDNEQE